MDTPLVAAHTQRRTRLTTLSLVMIAGLVGNVLVYIALQALIEQMLIPPLAIITALTLVVAGVCATRWRWAAHLAVLWSVLSLIPGLEHYSYNLAHPAETGTFITTVLILGLSLVAVVAEIVQRRRQPAEAQAPRWLMSFLIGTATFLLGAILVAAIPAPSATAGVSPETLAQLPALISEPNRFDQAELRARVGETVALRLDNADTMVHSFDIDVFDVHVLMPSDESALALFTPSAPGTYTFYCGVPGHSEAGMVGTLIVEP